MSNNPYQGQGSQGYPSRNNYTGASDNNRPKYTHQNDYSQPSYSQSNNLLNQPTYKQRNRAMYSSTMQFSNNSSQGFTSLDNIGRFVGDEKKQHARDDFSQQNTNNQNQGTIGYFKNYANQNPSSSSTNNNTSTKTQSNFFDRFPSANLNAPKNPSIEIPQYSQQQSSSVNPNQTPQQKRKREIMQIKKQLDDLNKKMAQRSSQKKNDGQQNTINPLQNRANKSAVSQSLIFQSKNTQPSNDSSFKTSNPVLSIQQLYSRKKNAEGGRKGSFQTQQTNFKPKTYQNKQYMPQNYEKKAQVKKIQPVLENKYISKQQTSKNQYANQQIHQKYNIPKSQVDDNKLKFTPYSTSTQQTQQNYSKPQQQNNYGQKLSTQQNTTSFSKPQAQYTVPAFNKQEEPVMGFKKKKQQPAVFEASTNQNIQKPSELPKKVFGMKRTNSDMQQSSNQPKLKEFKKSDFIIGKKLGKGQFGQVMVVRHKQTGFLCGLKVMEKKQIRDQQYVGQIARELSIQFYLSHRNVAPLYGYFSDEDYVYLLIQYCIGGQLLERLRGQRRMNQRDVALIMKQVCQGIDYIHKQLIIHRDIKPQNILFNFGVVKISDFGWAVYRGHGLRKTASGSPLYYPPQIVKGQEYDDKIDVWNIGMMTYQCLLGKIPFRIYTQMDLDRIVSDDITFPSYVDVTDDAKDFILRTMRKKGQQRMQIRQMLRHPFITKQKDTLLDHSILEQFSRVIR